MEKADKIERRLAAILSADVRGYSRMMAADDIATVREVKRCREIIDAHVREHHGRVVDAPGDNILAEFPSAVEAVQCAVEIQHELADRNRDLERARQMEFRIGVHLGDVISDEDRIYGDGVNIAARLEALAIPGGICISSAVHEQIRGKLDIDCEDIGEQRVKNIPRPVRVLRVRMENAPPGPLPATTSSRLWRVTSVTGVVAAAALLAVAGWRFFGSESAHRPTAGNRPIRSIAVLPLENLSDDASQEFFADGMTEELTTELAKINALRVISHTSVMRYKGERRKSLPEIAKELNVDGVVEGSVLRIGDKVRITTQLVDAPADKHIWAQSYERDSHDVLAMQDEVAAAIAREIDVHLTPQEQAGFSNAHQVSPEAHEAYLKGIFYWHLWTEEGWEKSIEYLEQAVKADPDFAAAYGALARSYADAAETFAPSGELMPKAKAAAEKALVLDPSNGEAYTALGVSKYYYEFDRPGAEREFQRAIAEHPEYSESHHHYGYMLSLEGRDEESLAQYRKARELDPFSFAIAGDMTVPLTVLDGPEKAFEHTRRLVEMDPNNWEGRFWLGVAYMTKGQIKEGIAEFERVNSLWDNPFSKANLGYWYAVSGDHDRARKLLDELERESKVRFVSPYYLAWVHLGLRENNRAVEQLVKSYDVGSTRWLMLLKQRQFDPLRSDPRFQELLKRVHLDK